MGTSASNTAQLSIDRNDNVRRHLERILQSSTFRGSKRCQQFLRYIVETTLAGRTDALKERSIGIEVFGRSASYETSEDAIVRVTANEVRKRLAQFYVDEGRADTFRVTLPAGSYAPAFVFPERVEEPVVTPSPVPPGSQAAFPTRWALASLALIVLCIAAAMSSNRAPSAAALQAFWKPVLESSQPVLICLPRTVVYQLSRRVQDQFLRANPSQIERGSYVLPLEPGNTVMTEDIVPVVDQYLAIGDTFTALKLDRYLGSEGKQSQLRSAGTTDFSDLRASAVILVGGYSNAWTMEVTKDLRFSFGKELNKDGTFWFIRDNTGVEKKWRLKNIYPSGLSDKDYAIISRVQDPNTGTVIVTAAGIMQYGTQAAGEFLTEARYLESVNRLAKVDSKRNLQVVLEVPVVGAGTGVPKILAVHTW